MNIHLGTARASILDTRFFVGALLIFCLFGFVTGQETDPYKAAAAQAPSMADAPLEFKVISTRNMVNGAYQYIGWTPVVSGRILGTTRSGDAVTVEFSQAGKVLRTIRAPMSGNRGETWFEDWDIRGDESKDVMTAVGTITAAFKYVDDTAGKTIPLSTRQFNVVKIVGYEEGKNIWKYGALYDDLLGFSYVVQRPPSSGSASEVWLYTWMNLEHDSLLKDITYKIEVDGKPIALEEGFTANGNHESIVTLDQTEEVYIKAKGDRAVNRHNLYLVAFRPRLQWGTKKTDVGGGWKWMADHPGKWTFKIRNNGEVVRELRFTVLPNGTIQPHPEQKAGTAGAFNLGPGRFFVETYFPNPNAFDKRFDPDPIRAGVLYGRPWISMEVKEGMLKVLPPRNPGAMPFPQPSLPPSN